MTYFVVRRLDDGYVAAMNRRELTPFDMQGCELLMQSDNWDEALTRIIIERGQPDYPDFEWQHPSLKVVTLRGLKDEDLCPDCSHLVMEHGVISGCLEVNICFCKRVRLP